MGKYLTESEAYQKLGSTYTGSHPTWFATKEIVLNGGGDPSMLTKYNTGQFIPEEDIKSGYLNYGPISFTISAESPEYSIKLSPPFDPSMDFQMYFTVKSPYTTYERGYIGVMDENGQNEFLVMGQEGEVIFSDAYDYYTNLGPMSTDFTFDIEKYHLQTTVSLVDNISGQSVIKQIDIASLGNKCYTLRVGQVGDKLPTYGYTIEDLVFVNFKNK